MTHKPSKYNTFIEYDGHLLIYNSLHHRFYELKTTLEDADSENLIKRGILVREDTDEDSMAYAKMVQMLCDSSKLSLTILPTFACNFRCSYCYEDHEAMHMSSEVEESIVRYLRKNAAGKNLHIGWFGGEPLLCKETVYHITEEAKKIANYYHRSFESSMTTNGYFLDLDTFKKLLRLNLRTYQITIDGSESSHNKTRPCVGGRPSYRTIIDNLKAIRDNVKTNNFNIIIRVNLLTNTLKNINNEIQDLRDQFGSDKRFRFFFKEVGDYGGEIVHDLDNDIIDHLGTIDRFLLENPVKYNIVPTSNVLNYIPCCYAAQSHSFIILPDGRVSKCTVHFDHPNNQVGKINPSGKMELNQNINKWSILGRFSFTTPACQKCALLANCFGVGCPSQRVIKGMEFEYELRKECRLKQQSETAIALLYKMNPELFEIIE